jgi:OOP family OmpA-OmpF porin
MKKISIALLTTAAMAFALPAGAQGMSNIYIGGSIGQSKFNTDCPSPLTCDDKDTAFKIFGGYAFNRNIAAELGWQDLGKAKFTGPGGSDELKGSAFDLTGVFTWPFSETGFNIFGRLGFYSGKLELSGVDTGSKTTTNVTYGLGAGYDINKNFGLRAEWQRYSKMKVQNDAGGESDGDVDALSIGVLWRF